MRYLFAFLSILLPCASAFAAAAEHTYTGELYVLGAILVIGVFALVVYVVASIIKDSIPFPEPPPPPPYTGPVPDMPEPTEGVVVVGLHQQDGAVYVWIRLSD